MPITDIFKRIEQIIKTSNEFPIVIAIDGMSASGKTTLANALHKYFSDSNLFHMDDYFLQPHQRTAHRLSEIGGNVDYERFHDEIILHLTDKNGFTHHKFDCHSQRLGTPIHAVWKPIIFIEGAYSQHPYFGDVYTLRIFCEVKKLEQRNRILKRNGKEMLQRFESEWIPKENAYFTKYKIKEQSGLLQ